MLEELKENRTKLTNERLCEIIVSNRYLGIMQEAAIICMEELAERRLSGSDFAFEDKITELMNDLPKLNIDINKIIKTTRFF